MSCGQYVDRNKKGYNENAVTLCFIWCRNQESNSGPTDYKS